LILEVWGRIVLKYLRVRTSRIDPKIPCLRRSQQEDSCNMRASAIPYRCRRKGKGERRKGWIKN